ncbi:hypothetical protein Hamer_G019756 [Homarus americanus]|uniref:Uncharacterized protein n=1 Tax=Homarus americanus TaxID=6706 RepID=A0A8J5K3L2_HOMAM|nr:hypothetical protein Hamer_G019756 [Homarus americanus]
MSTQVTGAPTSTLPVPPPLPPDIFPTVFTVTSRHTPGSGYCAWSYTVGMNQVTKGGAIQGQVVPWPPSVPDMLNHE